ncbi:MAG: shikimate dehydrogenase [Paludibacteraceae bacterium]|nr:shikimate dehydrogenase [Paludibacteraceae bacterium]
MKHYGIIGKPLEHSWSARWFTEMFRREGIDADYKAFETEADTILPPVPLDGFNVTCPYKEAVIPLLDEADATAAEIGAVNTVVRLASGRLKGYNTDWKGFTAAVRPLLQKDMRAIVLGTGGAAKAVVYALEKLGVEATTVSRNAQRGLPYSALTEETIAEHRLIVNCTPLGMYPQTEGKPQIPYEGIGAGHVLYDCIYNPEETLFLREGRQRGARTENGLGMLTGQAKAAWELWSAAKE